jgi:hypothetical protein
MTVNDIAPDGTLLGMTHNTLHVVRLEGDSEPRPLLASAEPTRQDDFPPTDVGWFSTNLGFQLNPSQRPFQTP